MEKEMTNKSNKKIIFTDEEIEIKLGDHKAEMISGEWSTKIVRIDNVVIKYGSSVRLEEVETIEFISNNTSIPVPKVFNSYERNGKKYIIMEYVKGIPLNKLWRDLSKDDKTSISLKLKGYIDQLKNLRPDGNRDYIGSVNNGPCIDVRRTKKEGGPFKTEKEFNKFILSRVSPKVSKHFMSFIMKNLKKDHKIVFTHGDIAARNIIIREERGRKYVACILDWELSGWYPEYWEYLRSVASSGWEDDWSDYVPLMMDTYNNGEFFLDYVIEQRMLA